MHIMLKLTHFPLKSESKLSVTPHTTHDHTEIEHEIAQQFDRWTFTVIY